MRLLYEDLKALFPSGYTVELDNVPANSDVVVLTEKPTISTTDELLLTETTYLLTSDIQVYVSMKDDTVDNAKVISDLIDFFKAIKEREGQTIGTFWIWEVVNNGGPTYLGRQGQDALFSMSLKIKYKI